MTTVTKEICDRCGKDLVGPHHQIGMQYHHLYLLDICSECEVDFTIWLGKHPMHKTTIEQMKNGKCAGSGYPSQDRLKDLP